MKTAIIGLPMTGKTSLFAILTGVAQESRIGSTAVRTGVAKVPDPRVDALAELYQPPKISYATVEYIDAPSISKENLRDPGYLASLRVVDAFAHVLRVFQDETVPHEHGSVDPARDFGDVETELILSDLVVVEKRLERLEKDRKKIKDPGSIRNTSCWFAARLRSKMIRRCAISNSIKTKTRHSRLSVPVAKADAAGAQSGRRRCRQAA